MKKAAIFMAAVALSLPAVSYLWAESAQKAAPSEKVNLGGFVKEIMCMQLEASHIDMAMWIPLEFYVASALNDGKTTREAAEKELAFLKPYLTVFVMSGVDQPDGTQHYAAEDEVRKRAVIRLDDGTEIRPLQTVPPKMVGVIATMKASMGSSAEKMHCFVYPNQGKDGKPIIDGSQRGKLTMAILGATRADDVIFTWRTPFDAVVKAPPCSKCGETVSAKWLFCPWCGQKLAS